MTTEKDAEDKIEAELEKQGWEKIDSNSTKTGYDKYVQLPDGTEADYVLYSAGQPVAIIEAKRASKNPRNHLQQARNYATEIDSGVKYSGVYNVPFVFASNGDEILVDDLREGTPDSRTVKSFYSSEDIRRRLILNPKQGLNWLNSHTYEDTDKELWEHQQDGLDSIKEALTDRKEMILVSMATGSGKTRLAMALTYQLLESDYAGRVLFLPDTKQLERDGLEDFRKYDPIGSPRFSDRYIVRDFNEYRDTGSADVVVSTIQKAYTELRDNPEECSVGEFDVIIVDESHRGIYNEEKGYGEVLEFYDSIEIGLTATPHQKTLQRYNNNHVHSYGYDEALADDKVAPFRPHVIQTQATMEGIDYDGEHYPPSEFGRDVLIHDTHRKVARELIDIVDIENELTLVFAQNVDHANVIAEDFREVLKNELDITEADEFVKTITNEDRHSDATLEDFKDKRKLPRIAVSVRMVSTGVDVRELKNLVFLRAVRSPILYNQMVGRGTRNTPQKEFFRIFDSIGVFDYHSDQIFSTENIELQYDDSETATEPVEDEDPKEIDDEDVDRVVKQYQAYPLPDEFATAEKFISEVSKLIDDREEDLKEAVKETTTIEEADEAIEDILSSEWGYYTQDYLLNASSDDIESLFELASKVLLGHNTIKMNAKQARESIEQDYDLSEEQSEWINLFSEHASLNKGTITKRQLLNKPFSNRGGYDRAREVFDHPDLETIISEFNKHLLSLENDDNDQNSQDGSTGTS